MTAIEKIQEFDDRYGEDWSNATDMIAQIMEEYAGDYLTDYLKDQDHYDAQEN